MSNISDFFNMLFGVEIAVFGIITAVIFVFMQIIYSNFSYRHVKFIFQDFYFRVCVILSIITLFSTATGSLLLSLGNYDFIPQINFNSINFISENYFALVCLIATFLSIILFLIFFYRNLRYLQPSKILLLISKNINNDKIRKYLFKRYGIRPPEERNYDDIILKDTSTGELNKLLEDLLEKAEEKYGYSSKIDENSKKAERKLKEHRNKFDKLEKEVKHSIDPFEPIDDIILKAISVGDLRTINETVDIINKISKNFIKSIPESDKKEEWNPDSVLAENYANYIIEIIKVYLEICEKQNINSAKIKILTISENVAKHLWHENQFSALLKIISFWKKIADNAIDDSSQIFNTIIDYYNTIGNFSFNKQQNISDEVFRDLGWLGERLLSKKKFETKPLMCNDDYNTQYDKLFNTISSFSYEYNNKHPKLYPLIYFDAIGVIFLQLVKIYKKNKISIIKEKLSDYMYIYSSFGKNAMMVGNGEGATLAVIRLEEAYKKLIGENLTDTAKEMVRLLVGLAVMATIHKKKIEKGNWLNESLDEHIINILETSSFIKEISAEINESYTKLGLGSNHKTVWNFIKVLGKKMQTNFGFMFDWETGELYPKDDPRRK